LASQEGFCSMELVPYLCQEDIRYVVGSKSFRLDIQKPRQMENAGRDIKYFLNGTQLLVHRCEKCVEIKGDCTEKHHNCFTLKS
jgi:hypothetical protein